jgi:tripeptide aminopeptidase
MSDQLVNTFCDMVRIDSESGEEARFIDYLKRLFERELGAKCRIDAYGNLSAHVPAKGTDATEPILLGAHADTVKPGVGIEPLIKDGVIRSAGETILGADDKAGIAEIFEAVRTAKKRPPVEIGITRSEEIGLLGARHLDLSMFEAKMGFIIDGEDPETIVVGGPTHVGLDITITGKAAHAGMEPEKGISAIRTAAIAIANMPEGRIDEETTANVGIIRGGLVRNGVPETATIAAECRSLDHEKCMRQSGLMQRAFREAARKMGASVDIREDIAYQAAKLPENAKVVQLAKQAVAAVGLTPTMKVITGGTDALALTGRGLEAVVLGHGGKAPHSKDEHIHVSDLERVTEIIRELLYATA